MPSFKVRFVDKVVIITGAGSGIGRTTALTFATEKAKVVVVDLNVGHGNETVKMIQDQGGEAIFVSCDVGVPAQVENVIQQAVTRFDRVDVIVNNAAMMTFAPVTEVSVEEWDRVMNVNLRSAFLFSKYGIPKMKGGAIVNISSVHAHETTPNNSPYASSKGAIESFTRAISRECPPEQVRINSVAPGAINTPMLWNNPNVKSGKEKIEGAVGQPEDIAYAVCFLASDEAKFINGTTLVVDGGRLDIL